MAVVVGKTAFVLFVKPISRFALQARRTETYRKFKIESMLIG
jgi:hypothetical protein